MWFSAGVVLATVGLVQAQSSSSTSTSTSATTPAIVPTGTAISGSYDGHYRPRVHFSAPQGFINDPNGMFLDDNGTYHLYYQYNPTDTIAGNQHWGHATSQDLYHWTNQPIALAPRNSTEGIFSGSAVVDVNNTSGFFPNQTNGVVAVYTINGPNQQTQDIAYSVDGGYTFVPYEGNPVIEIGSPAFRDPKVFWYEDHWVMAISFVQEFSVGIYVSNDLITWNLTSNFTHHGLLGAQWECPNLVQMPMEGSDEPLWLMYVSIQPGAPIGGSIGQYFPGHFNGTHFESVDSACRIADWGKDNYAAQFFSGIPGTENQISIAWASNWQYTNLVPTGPTEGWQSCMSLPRVNYLRNATRIGYVLVSEPYGIDAVRASSALANNDDLGADGTLLADFSSVASGAIMIDVNMTNINTTGLSSSASVNFTIYSSASGESISGGQFVAGDGNFWLNRGRLNGFEDQGYFTNKFSVANIIEQEFDFQVVVDRSILEVFSQRGEKSATLSIFPEYDLDTVIIKTGGLNDGVQISVNVYELNDAWAQYANSSGVVPGNGTMQARRDQWAY